MAQQNTVMETESLKLQQGGYLFDNEMMTQILVKTRKHIGKEVHQRHQERATSYNSNYKINKANCVCISYSDPQTQSWLLDLLFWLRSSSAFPEKTTAKLKVLISNTVQYSYNLNMILIRIKNCTLSIGVLRNKHQLTIRKLWNFVSHKILIFLV